jgi:hypothetical protein
MQQEGATDTKAVGNLCVPNVRHTPYCGFAELALVVTQKFSFSKILEGVSTEL